MRSKPYHSWARLLYDVHTTDSAFSSFGHSGHVYPIGNTFVENQPDDLVERVFLDVKVGGTINPTTSDTINNSLWPAGVTMVVAAAVTSIGSGVIPDPSGTGGPDPSIVLTGSPEIAVMGPQILTRTGYETGFTATWTGSFESQGTRLSPLLDTGPAVQAALWFGDSSGLSGGEPFAPISSWSLTAYLRVLFASRVPY